MRIWNIARTQSEIQETLNIRLRGDEPGLVAYWPLDEGRGQLVHDMTSNKNNGQLGNSLSLESSDPIWVLSTAPLNLNNP